MARKGRELEVVIERLEKLMANDAVKITSPDYLYDSMANTNREVDVSIRGKIGSHEILIIIECRDRRHKQDVTWIEQIATKTQDLRADKVVAVSSSGFSSAAKTKAQARNIELRVLKEFDPDEVSDWIEHHVFMHARPQVKLIDVQIDMTDKERVDHIDPSKFKQRHQVEPGIAADKLRFIVGQTDERIYLLDIVEAINSQNNNLFFRDLLPNTQPVVKEFALLLCDPSQIIFCELAIPSPKMKD